MFKLLKSLMGQQTNPSGYQTHYRNPSQSLLVGNTKTGGGIANTLVSGIDQMGRYKTYEIMMNAALNEGKSLICIYDGNTNMLSFMKNFCQQKAKKLVLFTNGTNNYDPLASLTLDEFCNAIQEIGYASTRYNNDTNTLLEILKIIKQRNGKNINFISFANCKYDKLDGAISNLHLAKKISDSEEINLKGMLNATIKEQFNLKSLFTSIINDAKGCIDEAGAGESIESALTDRNNVVMIKLDANQNKSFGKLVTYELYNYLNNAKRSLLIMENYLIPRDSQCYRYISSQPYDSKWLIGADNICSLCLNEDKEIDYIFQNARRFLILKHTDFNSSNRFANFLGKFNKTMVDQGKTHGATFLGFTQRDKISYTNTSRTVEEFKFKPEYIQALPQGKGIYRDFDCDDLSIQVLY